MTKKKHKETCCDGNTLFLDYDIGYMPENTSENLSRTAEISIL